ncbi:50S ribosomal protein L11 methyltransferase [Desulfovibrio subterraneus]|uniref:50S ribosomal protein L11 methyltransferase n=1 Tax=Desulfovibrio subterraneus TaxID=2718620 RepID=UPI0022B92C9C|nr:50S ribosomal protein L11 methyltransferase [Desulfovibrio subterraneus]WBF67340.1 50S ribosomal protein L11 methyltransferase [Desulfovibrio subterraneus]
MEHLIKLDITVPEEMQDLATVALVSKLQYGWEEETLPTGDIRYRVYVENPAFCEEFLAELRTFVPDAQVERDEVENQNWAMAWREFFTPVKVGNLFMVIAPWMTEMDLEGRIPIVIEPKSAFGTGHHPTTALCLGCVSKLAEEGRIREGMNFFDIGTGSGILGIGCAKLGLKGLGVDIDTLAVENSEENREINGVTELFDVAKGSADYTDDTFDVVLANILAQPLKDLASDIIARVAAGGCLVLSGLLATQADSVEEVYVAQGLPAARREIEGEWAALIWERL